MFLELLMFWTRETLANIRRNLLMSLLAVSSVTVALFILGAFYLALSNGRAVAAGAAQQLELAVILDRDVTPARRKQLYDAAHIAQVRDLEFVSKTQALKEIRTDPGVHIPTEGFEGADNPFGDELRLKLFRPEDSFKVRDYLGGLKGVSYVRFDGQVAQSVIGFNRLLAAAGLLALCVLSLGALLIVHNTIRLTIFARRREVRIMELVGATPAFIRTPFVLEGTLYGLCGGVLASLLLSTLYSALGARPERLIKLFLPLSPAQLLPACWGATLLAGLLFGVVGSCLSLARGIGKAA